MIWLFQILAHMVFAISDPYLVESKVQLDLENGLMKMIPREEFLVQVHTDIVMKSERKLFEGESIQDPQVIEEETAEDEEPMPGFLPEPETQSAKKRGPRLRQVFRVVDSPELQKIGVMVSFDDSLKPDLVNRARTFVQNYLKESYPNKSNFVFATVPMLKPIPPPTPTPVPAEFDDEDIEEEGFEFPLPAVAPPKPDPTWYERLWESKWFFFALVGALLYFILHWRTISVRAIKKKAPINSAPHPLENLFRILIPGHHLAKDSEKPAASSTGAQEEKKEVTP